MVEPGRHDEIQLLLETAIDAAKSKQITEARALLRQVLTAEPGNATAWLWMSAVLSDPLKREACLRKAVDLDPENAVARRGFGRARQAAANHLLLKGIEAAEQGDAVTAHKLLTDVVMRDEQNLDAWLWLSRVVDSADDREVCYENILTLDPENAIALDGLELLRQARAAAEERPWDEVAPDDGEAFVASTLAGDVLGEEYREKYTTEVPEPEPKPPPASDALWEKYGDPARCPYCTAETLPSSRVCPSCRSKLWIKYRPNQKRSTLLWILIALQILSALSLAALPFAAVLVVGTMVGAQYGIGGASDLIPAYLGLPSTASPGYIQAVQAMFPPVLFWVLFLPMVVGLVFVVGLYLRWRIMYYLMLANAVIGLMGSIASMAFTGGSLPGLIGGLFGVAMSFANAVIMLKLEQDFQVQRLRIHLALDKGVPDGMGYLQRGRAYAASKMWALAAIHFRQAAAQLPASPDGLIGIAQSTVKIGDRELAQWALEGALERDPDNHRIVAALEALTAREEEPDSGGHMPQEAGDQVPEVEA